MFLLIEQYIFYLFLFSIPFQTRKILYYEGWRFNEWQSISLYATDLLLILLLGFLLFKSIKIRRLARSSNLGGLALSKSDYFLFAFIAISAISIKNSDNYLISLFQWIKLIEFTVFYWYLSNYAFKKFGLFNSFLTIFISGIFQAIVAMVQFFKQSNIGLKYLGESVINNDFSGVASFYISSSEKIIRAYGTMPHPNVLAAFLLLAAFSFYFIYLYSRLHSEHPPSADYWDKFFLIFYGILLFGFFTTFSRTVIFVWFITFCIRSAVIPISRNYRIIFGTKNSRIRIRAILLVTLFTILLFGSLYFHESISRIAISGDDQAVELRSFYAKEALKTNINLFGVGLGNFMSWLIKENPFLPAYAYQPVHNIYLLIYAETGILGISAFVLFIVFLVKDFIVKTRLKKAYYLSSIFLFAGLIFIGIFDHMFWTLQQGRFIFWLTLALLTFYIKDDTIKGQVRQPVR